MVTEWEWLDRGLWVPLLPEMVSWCQANGVPVRKAWPPTTPKETKAHPLVERYPGMRGPDRRHTKLAGFARSVPLGSAMMPEVTYQDRDYGNGGAIVEKKVAPFTKFYSPASIFSITPCTEEMAVICVDHRNRKEEVKSGSH